MVFVWHVAIWGIKALWLFVPWKSCQVFNCQIRKKTKNIKIFLWRFANRPFRAMWTIADLCFFSRHPYFSTPVFSRLSFAKQVFIRENVLVILVFAFFFAYNVLVSLKMNYSYDDSRALNLWQRVHFNTDSSNDASSRADAWRRLLVQLQTFRRRLATTFNNTKLKSL